MFTKFFTEIEPSLARKIPSPKSPFENLLEKGSTTLLERYLNPNLGRVGGNFTLLIS